MKGTIFENLIDVSKKIEANGFGFLNVDPENTVICELGSEGFIEIFDGDVSGFAFAPGEIAVVVSSEGERMIRDYVGAIVTREISENTTAYTIEKGVNIAPIKKNSGKKLIKFPFDLMEVDDSFHVPVSDSYPNPGKTLQTTVSSATSRYSINDPSGTTRKNKSGQIVPVKIKTREFSLRTVGIEDLNGPGARVYRTK